MGYYVSMSGSNVAIKKEHLADAYKAMCELNEHDELKTGGSSLGNKWFAWMPEHYPTECEDAKEILEYLGFSVSTQDDGGLWISGYDSKIGQEEVFLYAIAPYVDLTDWAKERVDRTGVELVPEMEWVGEDGEFWKYIFKDKKMYSAHGKKEYGVVSEVRAMERD